MTRDHPRLFPPQYSHCLFHHWIVSTPMIVLSCHCYCHDQVPTTTSFLLINSTASLLPASNPSNALVVKHSPANVGDARDAGLIPAVRKDPLEEEMATHSDILAWRIPRTEEPGGLMSTGFAKSQTRDSCLRETLRDWAETKKYKYIHCIFHMATSHLSSCKLDLVACMFILCCRIPPSFFKSIYIYLFGCARSELQHVISSVSAAAYRICFYFQHGAVACKIYFPDQGSNLVSSIESTES